MATDTHAGYPRFVGESSRAVEQTGNGVVSHRNAISWNGGASSKHHRVRSRQKPSSELDVVLHCSTHVTLGAFRKMYAHRGTADARKLDCMLHLNTHTHIYLHLHL